MLNKEVSRIQGTFRHFFDTNKEDEMMNIYKNRSLMVTIRCITYNQEAYIRECLEGFVNQKTNFRFEAIVHDDASTDNTANIIREYAEKYPDIIKPIFETENQYSKHDGSLGRIMGNHMHGKYVAICEGDDYWIDPMKLQKQVDFMESHPNHSLCFCSHKEMFHSGSSQVIKAYEFDTEVCPMSDIIIGGGGFMATCSMLYRTSMYQSYTTWAENCPVGDAPLMLTLSQNGLVGYIADVMCVYRRFSTGSWSNVLSSDSEYRKKHHHAIIQMWHQFDQYSNYKYHDIIQKKIRSNRVQYYIDSFLLPLLRIKRKLKF